MLLDAAEPEPAGEAGGLLPAPGSIRRTPTPEEGCGTSPSRPRIAYRPRPWEFDESFDVLFDSQVQLTGGRFFEKRTGPKKTPKNVRAQETDVTPV